MANKRVKNIFVSYSKADSFLLAGVLKPLEELLKSGRLTTYIEREELPGGLPWEEEILAGVRNADAFLVLVDRNYLATPFVRDTEWPRIRQRLADPRVRLFWIPMEDDYDKCPDGDPEGICRALEAYQMAYGKGAKAYRSLAGPEKQNRLEHFLFEVEKWLDLPEEPQGDLEEPGVEAGFDGDLREKYLKLVREACEDIKIGNLGKLDRRVPLLPLRDVYITLSVDKTTLENLKQARYLDNELAHDKGPALERGDAIAQIVEQRSGRMPQPALAAETSSKKGEGFEEVFARERVLVTLGDPGSGKSVLCRWVARQAARRDEDDPSRDIVWLGAPRVPILIRTARFAEFLQNLMRKGKEITGDELLDFMDQNFRDLRPEVRNRIDLTDRELGQFCRQEVLAGRSILLIDGLDEVGDSSLRGFVSLAIKQFISRHVVLGRTSNARDDPEYGLSGNQVVITSRITGYHLAPLEVDSAYLARIRPLEDEAVKQLCLRMGEVKDDEQGWVNTGQEFYDLLESRSKSSPGIRVLKQNPLLLTSMFVYFVTAAAGEERRLPKSRAELYRHLVIDLAKKWRLEGVDREEPLVVSRSEEEVWPRLRAVLEKDEAVLKLLSAIAQHLHDNGTGGRMARPQFSKEVRRLLERLLGPVFGVKRTESGVTFADECTDLLLRLICQDVGVLVETGQDLFAFMHLTFQEYLVGLRMLDEPERAGVAGSLGERFVSKMDDPRWREPLLFAFSELAARTQDSSCVELLQEIRTNRRTGTGGAYRRPFAVDEGAALFLADLFQEIPEDHATDRELHEVLTGMLDEYRACGPRESAELVRWRISEKIAALRRGGLRNRVDQSLRDSLRESPDPSATAHLLWSRYWLPAETLQAMLDARDRDAAEWDWPIHRALRQSIRENAHLVIHPETITDPPEGDQQARALFKRGLAVWNERVAGDSEVELQSLPNSTLPVELSLIDRPQLWNSLLNHPRALRLTVATLQCVDDIEALRWRLEYRTLARFLSQREAYRDTVNLAHAEQVVWRWGSKDPVLAMALYLDTDPDGRFQRVEETPRVEMAFISHVENPVIVPWLAKVAEDPALADSTVALGVFGEAVVAKLALGQMDESARSVDALWPVQRAMASLRDAAFRGIQRYPEWLGLYDQEPGAEPLDDADAALVFRHLAALAVSCSQLPGPMPSSPGKGARLALAVEAHHWANGLVGRTEEQAYNLAVLLEDTRPDKGGVYSSITLLSAILSCPLLKLRNDLDNLDGGLWGVSAEERIVPPEAFEAIAALGEVADGIRQGFGALLVKMFLRDVPAAGFNGAYRLRVEGQFQVADTRMSFVPSPFATTVLRSLRTVDDSLDAAIQHQDAIETAAEFESLLLRGELTEKHMHLVELLADRVGEESWIDRCLFLLRMAVTAPAAERSRWLPLGIRGVSEITDLAVRAELLARLRRSLREEELALCSDAIQRLADTRPLLGAYAEGRLGNFLCRESFAWNQDPRMATDPCWVVASIYSSLNEAAESLSGKGGWSPLWKNLDEDPSTFAVSALIEHAGEHRIPCTEDAARVLTKLASPEQAEDRGQIALLRLVTLLEQPTLLALPYVQRWARSAVRPSPVSRALRIQGVLLLAEHNRSLSGISVTQLLRGFMADDLTRIRCEIALHGPMSDASRSERRFSLSTSDPAPLFRLARLRHRSPRHFGNLAIGKLVGRAFFDWIFDDLGTVRAWCQAALPKSVKEDFLITALEWTDVWSLECQREITAWALTPGPTSDQRSKAIVSLAARLVYLKEYEMAPEMLEALATIPGGASIRNRRCFPSSDRKLIYGLIADASRHVAAQPLEPRSRASGGRGMIETTAQEQLDSKLPRIFPGGFDGGPAVAPLGALGSLRYSMFFERPEDCMETIEEDLSSLNFGQVVLSWAEDRLDQPDALRDDQEIDRISEALLSFATCYSEKHPDSFARLARPDVWIPRLGRVCIMPASARSKMAAITLIGRLKSVDFNAKVLNEKGEPCDKTLLEGLLRALKSGTDVQNRLIQTLPSLLEVSCLWPELRNLLSDSQTSGSVLVAATQLVANMLNGNALNVGDRQEAIQLLTHLPHMAIHHRPLYRQAGSGKMDDPIIPIYSGGLREELARVSGTRI